MKDAILILGGLALAISVFFLVYGFMTFLYENQEVRDAEQREQAWKVLTTRADEDSRGVPSGDG
jgi:hypothetical protein